MQNKIKLSSDKIDFNLDDNIKIDTTNSNDFFNVKKITINILNNTNLEIEYNSINYKIDFNITIEKDVNADIFELNKSKNHKVKQTFNLNRNSNLNIFKFSDSLCVNEFDIINLNGEYSSINYELNTIATDKQIYNIEVNHNNKNTISNIANHGVNISGNIVFNVTGNVKKDMKNSELNQNNRIITFNDNKCKINPILCIDENDVVANHSALIGKFDPEEIFYFQSRGIDYNTAIIMLVKGFLLCKKEDSRLNKIIEKYWR